VFGISILSDTGTLHAIGALSKMVGITPDALRYYDEIGLLKPAYISPETGYRYYSDEQAAVLAQIMEMKHYGFSLNEIKSILKQGEAALTDMYLNRCWALEKEKKNLQKTIDKLSKKIKQRQEEIFMNKKILLVDDVPFMRMMHRGIFDTEGYEIAGEACDGLEAVELYKSLKPDVVVLNIVMPNLDGTGALEKIIEFDENARVVMCSAMGQAHMVAQALMMGARDFIVKPFNSVELLNAVRKSFNKVNLNRETLKQIREMCAENTEVISQVDVEKIIEFARLESSGEEIAAFVKSLTEKSTVEQKESSVEQASEISIRLDKLEQGMEEIKEMLRSMKQR
jgi:two-component system chemotaxis response regulator CheY